MTIMSIFNAINDSAALLLRSFNMYFVASLTSYTVNVFGRLIALFLFFEFGFFTYINFIVFLPFLVTIPIFFLLRRWISFKRVFLKSNITDAIKNSKSFAFSAYISYLNNYFDQFFVSIFMSADILGTFTLAKSLLQMGKTFIENLFDPLIQGLVKFKNDSTELMNHLRRILMLRNIILGGAVLFFLIFILFLNDLVEFLGLSSYRHIVYYIIFIILSQIFHVALKVKTNFISLFYPQSYYLKIALLTAVLSLVFFVIISLIDVRLLYLHIVLQNAILLLYSNYLFSTLFNKFITKT
jgi:O-antigen/teichoic acid export membrane protein